MYKVIAVRQYGPQLKEPKVPLVRVVSTNVVRSSVLAFKRAEDCIYFRKMLEGYRERKRDWPILHESGFALTCDPINFHGTSRNEETYIESMSELQLITRAQALFMDVVVVTYLSYDKDECSIT